MKGLSIRLGRMSPFRAMILGFAVAIVLGALGLMLPWASRSGEVTPFSQALFTATSAVCVTGLIVLDTGSHWSTLGQGIILLLIQIGGLGVVTVAASLALASGRDLGLMGRSAMQEASTAPGLGGMRELVAFILKATLAMELLGALALAPVFCRDYGWRGLWLSVFHSVSAFCNAGFDILGTDDAPFQSLTGYKGDGAVNITIMALIVSGGLGFLTWRDICQKGLHLGRYRLQTKAILLTTALLILIPSLFFFLVEFRALPMGERVLGSLFQAVSPRTAGFNTVELGEMSGPAQSVTILLMLIGGSPGSTAGGIKTTTLAVLIANAAASFRRREEPCLFHRRIEGPTVRDAAAIAGLYLALFYLGGLGISLIEGLPLDLCLYETASAVGTVGLTLGITPELGRLSQSILILLMFLGRLGGLTMMYGLLSAREGRLSRLPAERIAVG